MTNKPTFLVIKQTSNLTEYINTNHILRVTYTKNHDSDGSHALTIRLITGTIFSYVVENPDANVILKQWIEFLEQ